VGDYRIKVRDTDADDPTDFEDSIPLPNDVIDLFTTDMFEDMARIYFIHGVILEHVQVINRCLVIKHGLGLCVDMNPTIQPFNAASQMNTNCHFILFEEGKTKKMTGSEEEKRRRKNETFSG
jgi:hypothetical protein